MKNLFLIDGAAGSGKSDFFDFINEVGAQVNYFATALPKYTTREKRDDEDKKINDLIYFDGDIQTRIKSFMQKAEVIRKNADVFFEYEYPRGESLYGIAKSDIDKALKKYANVYIIIRSSYCISNIIKTYKGYSNINIIPVFIYSDKECVIQRLMEELKKEYAKKKYDSMPVEEKEKIIREKIDKRIERTNVAMNDYYTQPIDMYKEIIINNSNKTIYIRQMRALLEKYNDNFALTNNSIFIIMPMIEKSAANADNILVKNTIITASQEAGFSAYRADDVCYESGKLIIQKVFEAIKESDICIVDLTNNRPNCYLELGYARALNKEILLLIDKNDESELQFDVKGYEYYKYTTDDNGIGELKRYLQQKIALWKKRYIF